MYTDDEQLAHNTATTLCDNSAAARIVIVVHDAKLL